jgi:uncharacterized protein YcaQ
MPERELTLSEARRLALAAQGFTRRRPERPSLSHVRRIIHSLGLLQLDFVNVLVPSHYLVLFSRLGCYDRTLLDTLVYRKREFTEQWAHEASIIPVEMWPLLRHRMNTHRPRPWGFDRFLSQHNEYVSWVLEQVRERGPMVPSELPVPDGVERRLDISWFGTVPRAVLEALFGKGQLAIAGRGAGGMRSYDIAERVIGPELCCDGPDPLESQRRLLAVAAQAHGVGTAADLADYFRMPVNDARPRLLELTQSGELEQVRVEGWREPAYVCPNPDVPASVNAAALLSPFDPVVWFRPRTRRLFHFDYRFEIFFPKEQRRWGCYVLPFLLADRLVARIDVKADRERRRLAILSADCEPDAEPETVGPPLREELRLLCDWLQLDRIHVVRRSGLSRYLRP